VKYWGFFLLKVAVAGAALGLLWLGIWEWWPVSSPFLSVREAPFARDLGFTFVMMLHWLLSAGVFYLIIWDQRYRCRTCLRRLRMPVVIGSRSQSLVEGPPRIEYICTYGHGTLQVDELRLTGGEKSSWKPIRDIWEALTKAGDEGRPSGRAGR